MQPSRRIGPYEVVRQLGQGGMGVVFEVRDPQAPRSLALKLICGASACETAFARFWREAELLARVHHPGVVTIHKLGRAAEGPYLVLDLVDGRPLTELTHDGARVAPDVAAALVRDVAVALEAVHTQGILHRDLKPHNVMLRHIDRRPVLLDFGLAREVDSETLTKTGVPLGTPAYMSPEQAEGSRAVDARTDVYGAGTILYQLLTGRPPVTDESFVQVLAAVLAGRVTPVRSCNPDVPEELAAVVDRAMALRPDDRYPTAAALAQDLDAFLRGEPTEAAGRSAEVLRRRRRRRALVAAAGALCASVVAIGAVALWRLVGVGTTDRALAAPNVVPAAADTPAPSAPLWDLTAGGGLVFRVTVAEEEPAQAFSFEVVFEARVLEGAGGGSGLVELEGRCTAVALAFGLGEVGGTRFDTRDPDPTHPLAGVARGLGLPFRFTIDPASGALGDVRGATAVGKTIVAAAPAPSPFFDRALYRRVCGVTFSDRYIEAVLRSATQVRPSASRPIEWPPAAQADGGGEAWVFAGEPGPPVLIPLGLGWRPHADDRYRIDARARFRPGRLAAADVVQTHVGRAGAQPRVRLPAEARPASIARWTVEVVSSP